MFIIFCTILFISFVLFIISAIIGFKNYNVDRKMRWYDWMGFVSVILATLSVVGAGFIKLTEVFG